MRYLRKLNCIFESLPKPPFTIRLKTGGGWHFYTVTDTMLNLVKMEVTLKLLEVDSPIAYHPERMECVYSFLPN